MSATLHEIAVRAKVSRMTVSRVMNRPDAAGISPATRQRVLKIARELNYQPNITAKGLALGKTFLLGVLHSGVNCELLAELSSGIQRALVSGGYAPVVLTHRTEEEEAENLRLCMARRVDGLIVNPMVNFDEPNTQLYSQLAGETPLVEMNGGYLPGVPHVTVDFFEAGRMAALAAVAQQFRRVVLYIHDHYAQGGGDGQSVCRRFWNARDFYEGYMAAMREAGLEPQVVTYRLSRNLSKPGEAYASAHESAGAMLDSLAGKPAGIVCMYDETAMALARTAERRGSAQRILISGTGVGWAQQQYPELVRMLRLPMEQVGAEAVRMLLDRIDGKEVESVAVKPVADVTS